MPQQPPTFGDVLAAAERIAPFVHRTPVFTSATLDREVGARVVFKAENLQKVGAFKARGATNAVLQLDHETARRGVVTHSSGNHGQALAYAAAIRSIPCTVVMPDHAPRIKVEAVEGYGAQVVFCPHAEREATTARIVETSGATLVHPFDHPHVIAGQGTAALELMEDAGPLDMIVAPIGGGGLLSGTALATSGTRPSPHIVGAEPAAADDAYRSISAGERLPAVPHPDTIADGLLTGIGALPFEILTAAGTSVVTVDEPEIVEAGLFFLHRMKLVVEPSGATALAALRKLGPHGADARIGVIVSGGNTDFGWLPRIRETAQDH